MGYKYITFDKDMTAIIKGVAIVFMIFLHCFGWESWYLPEYHIHLSHSSFLYKIMTAMQICVEMYVFMIGYGYAFAKNKNIEYSFKHTSRLLKIFWSVLFLFVIPVSFKYTASKNAGWFFLNLFGIVEDLSWVSWFVALYIWSMILMPFLGRVFDRWRWIGMVVACIACYAGMTLIHQSVPDFNSRDWWHIIFVCLGWTPLIMFGYLTVKLKLVENNKDSGKWYNSIGSHNFNSGHTDIEIKISESHDIELRFNICTGYDIMRTHNFYIDTQSGY